MKRDKIYNEYMFDTKVENIFINEYMKDAPADFLKVYLMALMFTDLGKEMDEEKLKKSLGIAADDDVVERAWKYWERLGVVRREKGEIVFVSLKESLYGRKKSEKQKAPSDVVEASLHILDDSGLKAMFTSIEKIMNRPLNGRETESILGWIDVTGATPEIISYAYKYCVETMKKENVNYVGKVVESWTNKGFRSRAQAEEYLEEMDNRHYMYKRVLRAMGFTRNATENEKAIMDTWFDDFDFSMDMILEACAKTSGISNPNMNYVNTVLMNWNKEKTGKDETGEVTQKHVGEYYDFIREKAEREAKERKEEVYTAIPEIKKLDDQMKNNYISLTKTALGGGADKNEAMNRLKAENDKIRERIKMLLTENRVPVDYMEVRYKCPLCKDTGMTDEGIRCQCYIEREKEAAQWQK